MTNLVIHPWQSGPTELIQYAIKHLHSQNDVDRRIAYLLLDVGVETLLKTFLTLPDEVTNSQLKFADRKQASIGGFHELVRGVGKAAGNKLNNINLSHIQYYHDLRNKLYHEGNGITVPPENINAYAKIAVELLKALLGVDLTDEYLKPEFDAQKSARISKLRAILEENYDLRNKALNELHEILLLVLEKHLPNFTLPSFSRRFIEISQKYLEEYIYEVNAIGECQYAYRMSDDKSSLMRYQKELANFINPLVKDEPMREIFFEKEKVLLIGSTLKTISILKNTISNYPQTQDIQYRALELLLPESKQWLEIFAQSSVPEYALVDPTLDEIEALEKAIANSKEVLTEISRIHIEIQKWLNNN